MIQHLKKCIFVLGPAGSGKTYFVINTLLKTHKYKYLCVDDINLPYDDARSELKLQIAKSIENNENFITEGTGGKNSDEIYKRRSRHLGSDFLAKFSNHRAS